MNTDAILDELRQLYPNPKPELNFTNPYETLVATMLSAQCTDKQVNKVTPAVFARWPDAASMAQAPLDELFPMVKSCGFKSKAGNIIAACRLLVEKHGGEVPSTMEALTALPGVGRKTANVVLAEAFNIAEGIAVDTHVFRIAHVLGFSKGEDPVAVEKDLCAVFPPDQWVNINRRWVLFGREICIARRPKCAECPLAAQGLCPSAPKQH